MIEGYCANFYSRIVSNLTCTPVRSCAAFMYNALLLGSTSFVLMLAAVKMPAYCERVQTHRVSRNKAFFHRKEE